MLEADSDIAITFNCDAQEKDAVETSVVLKQVEPHRNCFSEADADSEFEDLDSDDDSEHFETPLPRRRHLLLRKSRKTATFNMRKDDVDADEIDYEMDYDQSPADDDPIDLSEVYEELSRAAAEMKLNLKSIKEREDALKKREQALLDRMCEFERIILANAGEAADENEDDPNDVIFATADGGSNAPKPAETVDFDCDILRTALAKRTNDVRRLTRDFSALKSANDALKNELEAIRQRNATLEEESGRNRRRIVNLKRLNEQLTHRNTELRIGTEKFSSKNAQIRDNAPVKTKKPGLNAASTCSLERDVLITTMRCLTDLHARSLSISIDSASQAIFVDYAIGVLPHFSELLRNVFETHTSNEQLELSLLTFILISILAVRKQMDELEVQRAKEQSPSRNDSAKWRLSATLRRIGDEIWKLSSCKDEKQKPSRADGETAASNGVENENENGKQAPDAVQVQSGVNEPRRLLNSPNLHVRVLSELIVLASLHGVQPSDVDRLVRTLNRVRKELLNGGDVVFGVYAAHDATRVLVGTLRHAFASAGSTANRVVLGYTLDALVHVAVRAPRNVVDRLLASLSEASSATALLEASVTYLRTKLPIGVAPKRSGDIAVTSDTHEDSMRIDDFDWRILEKLAIILQKLSASRSIRSQFSDLGVTNYVRALLERCELAPRRQGHSLGSSRQRQGSALSLVSCSSAVGSPATPRTCTHSAASDIDFDFLSLNLKSVMQNLSSTD